MYFWLDLTVGQRNYFTIFPHTLRQSNIVLKAIYGKYVVLIMTLVVK